MANRAPPGDNFARPSLAKMSTRMNSHAQPAGLSLPPRTTLRQQQVRHTCMPAHVIGWHASLNPVSSCAALAHASLLSSFLGCREGAWPLCVPIQASKACILVLQQRDSALV